MTPPRNRLCPATYSNPLSLWLCARDTDTHSHLLGDPIRNFLCRLLLVLDVFRQDDIRPGQLGSMFVRVDSNDGHVVHLWVSHQEGFEVGRGYLEAFVFDQFLDPIDDTADDGCV